MSGFLFGAVLKARISFERARILKASSLETTDCGMSGRSLDPSRHCVRTRRVRPVFHLTGSGAVESRYICYGLSVKCPLQAWVIVGLSLMGSGWWLILRALILMESQFHRGWEAMGTESRVWLERVGCGSMPWQGLSVWPHLCFLWFLSAICEYICSSPCSCHDAQPLNMGADCIDHQ